MKTLIRSFAVCTTILVAAPLMLTGVSCLGFRISLIDGFLFVFYYRLPYKVFGSKYFYSEILTTPEGAGGWLLTILLYTLLSVILALTVTWIRMRKEKTPNKRFQVIGDPGSPQPEA